MAELDMTPELEAAVAEVRECASAFGEDTAHFANGRFVCSSLICGQLIISTSLCWAGLHKISDTFYHLCLTQYFYLFHANKQLLYDNSMD